MLRRSACKRSTDANRSRTESGRRPRTRPADSSRSGWGCGSGGTVPEDFRQNRRTTESTERASDTISVVSVDSAVMSMARGYSVRNVVASAHRSSEQPGNRQSEHLLARRDAAPPWRPTRRSALPRTQLGVSKFVRRLLHFRTLLDTFVKC